MSSVSLGRVASRRVGEKERCPRPDLCVRWLEDDLVVGLAFGLAVLVFGLRLLGS